MLKWFVKFLVLFLSLAESHFVFCDTKFIYSKNIKIWTESFGKQTNPAVLLIIGAGAQSILWPDEFCEKLAKEGFFVIRYDHRDTGLSSLIDYQKNPYNIQDLADDAIAVLNTYAIQKAHIVGFSMGGEIAQFIGAYYPEKVHDIILMATSTNMEPGFNAFSGKYNPKDLSPPLPEYVKWATRTVDLSKQTQEEKLQDFIHTWQLLNGSESEFDTALYLKIAKLCFKRAKNDNPYENHAKAMQASFDEHRQVPKLIKVPTLIIHGKADPIFGIDHGKALNDGIANSKLVLIEHMGHALNPVFYKKIIHLMKEEMKLHNQPR